MPIETTATPAASEQLKQQLRVMLATKPGVFSITQARLDARQLEKLLQEQSARTNTSFDMGNIKISDLRNSVDFLKNGNLSDNSKISHLGLVYALETNGTDNKIKLVVIGVGFDHSPTADLTLNLRPEQLFDHEFSNVDLVPANDANKKAANLSARDHFMDFFTPLFDNRKVVHAAYVRVKDFSDMLDTFSSKQCDELNISFGFMKAITPDDWNCFHLIFRGHKSGSDTFADSIFSTYDGEDGYSGPKPGCPPLKCR